LVDPYRAYSSLLLLSILQLLELRLSLLLVPALFFWSFNINLWFWCLVYIPVVNIVLQMSGSLLLRVGEDLSTSGCDELIYPSKV